MHAAQAEFIRKIPTREAFSYANEIASRLRNAKKVCESEECWNAARAAVAGCSVSNVPRQEQNYWLPFNLSIPHIITRHCGFVFQLAKSDREKCHKTAFRADNELQLHATCQALFTMRWCENFVSRFRCPSCQKLPTGKAGQKNILTIKSCHQANFNQENRTWSSFACLIALLEPHECKQHTKWTQKTSFFCVDFVSRKRGWVNTVKKKHRSRATTEGTQWQASNSTNTHTSHLSITSKILQIDVEFASQIHQREAWWIIARAWFLSWRKPRAVLCAFLEWGAPREMSNRKSAFIIACKLQPCCATVN